MWAMYVAMDNTTIIPTLSNTVITIAGLWIKRSEAGLLQPVRRAAAGLHAGPAREAAGLRAGRQGRFPVCLLPNGPGLCLLRAARPEHSHGPRYALFTHAPFSSSSSLRLYSFLTRCCAGCLAGYPRLQALHEAVGSLPGVGAYLASKDNIVHPINNAPLPGFP